jgi:hypothetical protein
MLQTLSKQLAESNTTALARPSTCTWASPGRASPDHVTWAAVTSSWG